MRPSDRPRVFALVAAVVVLFSAGVSISTAGDSTGADVAGLVLMSIAGVLAISAVFYAIGTGEDRDREERRRRP